MPKNSGHFDHPYKKEENAKKETRRSLRSTTGLQSSAKPETAAEAIASVTAAHAARRENARHSKKAYSLPQIQKLWHSAIQEFHPGVKIVPPTKGHFFGLRKLHQRFIAGGRYDFADFLNFAVEEFTAVAGTIQKGERHRESRPVNGL